MKKVKILFFDMEFANGQVPGSIYSIGYLVTDECFEILVPQTDLLINPECQWNEYVEKNILAYPKEEVEAAPAFPVHYDFFKKLFEEVDLAVGFSVSNDIRALKKDCARYALPSIDFRHFDTERLCKLSDEHKEAHGLGGYVLAWCGEEPDNRHRSDGDAYATMMLLRAVCKAKHVDLEMMLEAYPECVGDTRIKEKKPAKKTAKKPCRRRRRRSKKASETATISEA